jgi:hypothetical protein
LKAYIINSIVKSYILNIKIRPLVIEYALMIELVDGTSSTHSFNPYAYFGHSWSYFDIQNLRLDILYLFYFQKCISFPWYWLNKDNIHVPSTFTDIVGAVMGVIVW